MMVMEIAEQLSSPDVQFTPDRELTWTRPPVMMNPYLLREIIQMSEDTTTMDDTKEKSKASGWRVILGILVVIAGLMAIGSPLVAGVSVTIFVGAMIMVSGISQVIHAFSLKFKNGLIVKIILGILSVLVGLFLMVRPLQGLLGLTLIIGIFFIADGIGWIVMAFGSKPRKGWGWLLFSGIISVILGVEIFAQWPLSGVWAIGVLFGIRMLYAGLGMSFFGSAIRSGPK